MPKLTVGGANIEGILEAHVHVTHNNPKAPDPVPVMEWDVTMRLHFDDILPKWAMAKQSADRFKKCELIIYNNDNSIAHTWNILNAYVASYEEIEHPGAMADTSGEGGYVLKMVIRGHMLEAKDYTGVNVMTVAKGTERKLPG